MELALTPQQSLIDDIHVEDLGSIAIRVVVLPPKQKGGTAAASETVLPLDVEDGEEFILDAGSTPLGSYLENSRGKRCVVFLVNGQRQEALDNSFIVQDLGFKYLRSRMMIVVDVDGLAPEAIGKMMQGSRQGFYRGHTWELMIRRIVATLKRDPDLVRLEEEAEELVSELKAGDEKVKQTLDQLIDTHHDLGHDIASGVGSHGDNNAGNQLGFKTSEKAGVVTLFPPDKGVVADYPVLISQPASSIRLRPNQEREIGVKSLPSSHWAAISHLNVEGDPRVPELSIHKEMLLDHAKLTLLFREPEGFDAESYPVRAKLKVTAAFNGIKERRQLELPVLVKPDSQAPDPILLDEPTKLVVTSREPVQLRRSEGDTHVRMRWDGKDSLLVGATPKWKFSAKLLSPTKAQPALNFSEASAGRFSLLISSSSDWKEGENLKFEVLASGPGGKTLKASFEADVVDVQEQDDQPEKSPRLVEESILAGSSRRPPYQLRIITRDDYDKLQCWNVDGWTDEDPGSFIEPTERAPLTLIINQDMSALRDYLRALTKKNTEQDVERKKNKYTSHIAFHLYQMYQATQGKKDEDVEAADVRRRQEIRRVSMTMIRLMEVGR